MSFLMTYRYTCNKDIIIVGFLKNKDSNYVTTCKYQQNNPKVYLGAKEGFMK